MAGLRDDVRGALRRLAATPASSVAALLALAVGIGFSTATYSLADALLFRPLPLPGIERVVLIAGREEGAARGFRSISATDYTDWKASARSLESLAVTRSFNATLTGVGDAVQISGAWVTASFFDVVKLQPLLGRVFTSEEETPGRNQSIVLSQILWERQFGSDPNIVGRTLELSGHKVTVCGVMPKGFTYPQPGLFWAPLALDSTTWAEPGNFYLRAIGRLKPGVTVNEARAEFKSLAARIAKQRPDSHTRLSAHVEPLREMISGDLTAGFTRMSICFVLFLLLIACLNVANLQMARILSRTREMAIRTALGAPRWRLMRQVLVENVILSFSGAVCGLLVALWCMDLLKASMPAEVERWLPGWHRIGINGWILFWTAVTAAVSGIVSGLGPALWLSRTPIAVNLHEAGRSATGSAGRQRLRMLLVVTETALALVLLVGASLTVRAFHAIGQLPVSTDPARILTFRVSLPSPRYEEQSRIKLFQSDMLERLRAIPGVESAGTISGLPYGGSGNNYTLVTFEGRPVEHGPKNIAQIQNVGGDPFRTLGIPLVQGELFTGSEGPATQRVVLVNQAFVRKFYSEGNPLGRRLHFGDGKWTTIIGVVGDVMQDFTERTAGPAVYQPYQQFAAGSFDVALRASGDPDALIPAVRQAVYAVDPAQPLSLIRSFRKVIDHSILGIGYAASMFAVLGFVALFLAVLGVYSLMAWSVGERTREIGVRLALGATRAEIRWMVLRRGGLIAVISLALGLAGSFAVSRVMQGLLFGVSATDLATFLGVPFTLASALVVACLIPAQRATRTDPIAALRHE